MARNSDLKEVFRHIDTINHELGDVNIKIAKIETSWNWMKWIISGNVALWILVMGILLRSQVL